MRRRHQRTEFAGSLHFVTTVTAIRGDWFVDTSACMTILGIFENYRVKHNIACIGYVLMPDDPFEQ